MAVPSVSCTYSWPVWTEELTGGSYTLVRCMPVAHEPQLGLHSCPDGHPGGSIASPLTTVVDLQLPLQQQLHSLASQGNSSLRAAAVTYQADLLNV